MGNKAATHLSAIDHKTLIVNARKNWIFERSFPMKQVVKALLVFSAVLLLPVISTTSSRADTTVDEIQSTILTPILGPFLNIWLDDVGNFEPVVAYNSRRGEYLVVWSNTRAAGATKDIYARRIDKFGNLLSNFTITHNANFHNYDPAVAYNPDQDEYLVVWTYDSVITDSDVWARRINWNGSQLFPEFSLGRKDNKQIRPAVAYSPNANEYLVVYENFWGGSSDIDAVRVRGSDGTVLGWRNIHAGAGQFRRAPDVAYSPASNLYLIAYQLHSTDILNQGDIVGKVASPNLGDLSPEISICTDTNDQQSVALASSEGEFIAVWEDSPTGSTTEIYARRLTGDGTPLGPSGGFWISGALNRYDEVPDVTYGGGRYLIIWHRFMGGLDFNVYGRYASPRVDIGLGSEFTLDDDPGAQMHPTVACNFIGDCIMTEEDNSGPGGDFDIQGRMMWLQHVYLPLMIRH
jgi:hypothetical protein